MLPPQSSFPDRRAPGWGGLEARGADVAPELPAERSWIYSLALFLVALFPRLFVALTWAREPVWDGHYYHFGAQRIAAGLGYSEDVLVQGQWLAKPWTHYPVGYSGSLALVYRLFGDGERTAPLFGAVVGALLAVLGYQLARFMLSETRAKWAGALIAVHPGLIAYSALVMAEPLGALYLMLAFWAVFAARERLGFWVLGGLLFGLASLVRPASLLLVPLVALLGEKKLWPLCKRLAVVGLCTLLPILPWTARNCRVMDGCALISTNGGWNLAIGAITESGRFQTLRAADGCPHVKGQVHQDHCWQEIGVRKILSDPGLWLARAPKKLAQTFDHESFPIEYLHEAAPELWPEGRREAGRLLLTRFHWALLALGALYGVARPERWLPFRPRRRGETRGAWLQAQLLSLGRRRPWPLVVQLGLAAAALNWAYRAYQGPEHPFYVLAALLPLTQLLPGRPRLGNYGLFLLGYLGLTALTHVLFFGEDRYHMVLSPVFCIFAAGALSGVGSQWLGRLPSWVFAASEPELLESEQGSEPYGKSQADAPGTVHSPDDAPDTERQS